MEGVVIKKHPLFPDRRGRLGETFREDAAAERYKNDLATLFRLAL